MSETRLPYEPVYNQLIPVYKQVAEKVRYRPMAPSDGFGNITVPIEELDINREAHEFAIEWWAQENEGSFWIGYVDFQFRPALVYSILAMRLLAGAFEKQDVIKSMTLLVMAMRELIASDDGEVIEMLKNLAEEAQDDA
jgi:hypothetical protein